MTTPVAGRQKIFTKPRRKPDILARGLVLSGNMARCEQAPLGCSIAACETPTVAISGAREDGRCDGLQLDRAGLFTECVVHRDTSLHRSHRRRREQSGAVTVDAGNRGARDPVDTQVSTLVQLDADPLQAETVGVGDGTDGHPGVASFDIAAVGELDDDALLGALDGVCAAAC